MENGRGPHARLNSVSSQQGAIMENPGGSREALIIEG